MNALTTVLRRAIHAITPGRRGVLRRSAPVWLGFLVAVSSAIPPATGERPLPILPEIPVALAGYPCSSHSGEYPMFTGRLSNSSGTQLSESTTGDVYGRVTNVDDRWQPSPGCGYYRYDGIIWAQSNSTSDLKVHWGALSGDAQPCNYVIGSTDYIHAHNGACPGETTGRMVATLTPEWTYQNDLTLDTKGDFAFTHSDCTTWYTKNVQIDPATTSVTNSKPGANCGYKQLDGTGTTQTLVVDGTAPTLAFTYPPAGGPVLVPSAFAGVTFTATDGVAGFGGSDDWDLQRQIATWNGSSCLTFGDDTGTKALVSGTTPGANQVSSQGLQLNKCYRWTLTARDKNGNVAGPITSGSIRTDTSVVWGDQPQFRTEDWDLGAGDSLAVSTGSGNLRLIHSIVSLPIVGATLGLTASYNSHDGADIGLGTGWRLNVQRRLTVNGDGSVTFSAADGSRHTFTNPTGSPTVTYTRPATLYATLIRDTAATPDRFTLTYGDQSKDVFDEEVTGTGFLEQIKDRHNNTVTIAYSAYSPTAKISTITDPTPSPNTRSISFTWTGSYLTQIVDWANVSGGIVQTSGSGNRAHRFFYSGTNLIGWADPLDTSGSCPTAASHRTCLTYTSGFVSAIAKTQSYETFSAGTLGSATRTVTTSISYEFADVTGVTDAEAAATTLSHPLAGGTKVVRPGTPASETTYELVSPTDTYGRIDSVRRKLGGAQIETETTYSGTYPIEPATVKENKGGGVLERGTNYTYQASSLGLLTRLDEPLDGTYRRYTDFTYNTNNDVTRKRVYSTQDSNNDTDTRYCYTNGSCLTTSADTLVINKVIENYADGAAGGASGHVDDVITTFQYDAAGQRTRATRSNYSGSTLLDSAATAWIYDSYGNVTAEIRSYADGTVDCGTDDETPNATTNARTDLSTVYAYDTAGNRVSVADPRRAIALDADQDCGASTPTADDYVSRTVFDALNQAVTSRLPTTPGVADCGSPPGCRETTTAYDELGLVREAADINDLVTATKYDKAGRALETYEDPAAAVAVTTSVSTYDAAGRVLTVKDQRQVAAAGLGYTDYDYDELGRLTDVTDAAGSSPDLSSITHSTYDDLDRKVTEDIGYGTGTGQLTTWTYDIGGRTTKVDDEFTCATTTYDYRDIALTIVEGQASGSCSGSGLRTITNSYDGRGRLTNSEITAGQGDNDVLAAPTFDAAGNQLSTSATTGGSTTSSTFTYNPLDQLIGETRSEGGSAVSWTKANADAAGNPTDRCVWNTNPDNPAVELCKAVGQSFTTAPAIHSTSAYDVRNQRISLAIPSVGETTYDPTHNYQVAAIYVPTGTGKEHQSLYAYDSRHRLTGITHQLCTISSGHSCSATTSTGSDTYAYDDNDNRTRVNEANGAGTLDRYYCYDALNRIVATRSASGCSTGLLESYTYDDAGNRTAAGSTTFSYDAQGQLSSCSPTCGTIAYDATGRTSQWNGWNLTYDGEGRLASACKVAGCATGDMVTMRYDAAGRRVELVTRPNGGSATTTTFRYQGNAIAQELVGGSVSRTYVTDEVGGIVKFCDPDCTGSNPQYLVSWNGHSDAAAIWKVNADGTVTLANSFTYSTWGAPTTATHNSIADLGFRFLYVGQFGVAWDDGTSLANMNLGIQHMGARHYSPALGRFLQPDPSALESNLYAYVGGNPATYSDSTGLGPYPWDGLFYSWTLNPEEKKACAQFPSQCETWKKAVRWAVLYGAQQPGRQIYNAMRHCIWQCLLTHWLGWDWSRYWGTIHETGDPPASPRQRMDRKVDLHNNVVGRLLGQQLGSAGLFPPRNAMSLCVGAWDWGYLWYFDSSTNKIRWSDGRVVPNPPDKWSP